MALALLPISALPLVIHVDNWKYQMVASAAPWIIALIFVGCVLLSSVRNLYCLTDRRALALRFAPWGSKVSAVCLTDADAVAGYKMPLVFRDRRTGKDAVTMLLTPKQEAEVLSLLKRVAT